MTRLTKHRPALLGLFLLAMVFGGVACSGSDIVDCEFLDECPFGQVCLRSFCTSGKTCEVDADCGDPSIVCVNGVCVVAEALDEDFVNSPEPTDE